MTNLNEYKKGFSTYIKLFSNYPYHYNLSLYLTRRRYSKGFKKGFRDAQKPEVIKNFNRAYIIAKENNNYIIARKSILIPNLEIILYKTEYN